MSRPVVILGSGLAGYAVARELRKIDSQVPIVLVTENGGEFYSKPTLSNALALKRAPEVIATSSAAQMAVQLNVSIRVRTAARRIDPHKHCVMLEHEPLEYGKLVLAVGAQPIRPPGSGLAQGVHSVNTLDDYRRFRASLAGCGRVVILGAGFIGCEFANDLCAAGLEVDVVDQAPHPLQRFWPAPLANAFERRLAGVGVRWHLGRGISAIRREAGRTAVELDDGSVLHADIVLSALGLSPRVELAREAGLRLGRGIVVDAHLCSSEPSIYALGDCAEVQGQVLPFVMPIMHCGRALARTLVGKPTAVAYPPMPVALKTPACPVVFLPAPPRGQGDWSVEGNADDFIALYRRADGELAGAVLLGSAVGRRDEFVRRIGARQAVYG